MATDKKEQLLLQFLWQKVGWVTCHELAEQLGISPRSVRYLITKINTNGQEPIIRSSREGYRLISREGISATAPAVQGSAPANAIEREKYIFEHLVIQGRIADIEELSDQFHISPLTFRNELLEWKKHLSKYGLYLKTKNGRLYAVGSERDRQSFALNLINDELRSASFSLGTVQHLFQRVQLSDINRIVLGVFSKHQYYLDDYSLLTYVLHLALYIELRGQNAPLSQPKYRAEQRMKIFSDPALSAIVSEITEALSLCYQDADINWEAVADASMFMSTRIMSRKIDPDEMVDDIEGIVGAEVMDLIHEIVESIKKVYFVEIDNEKFMLRFAMHIKNLLIRVENGMTLNGGQFSNIKGEYPFLYLLAVHISYIISRKMNVVLAEEEISYIALHMGVMLQETTDQQEKLVCAVIAPDYHVIGKNLCKQLSHGLGDALLVDTLITDLDKIKDSLDCFDLIISAYPLASYGFPSIVTGPFLNPDNLSVIRGQVEELQQLKRKNKIISQVENYMRSDLVYFGLDFQTSGDAIEYICNDLFSKHLVTETFKSEIYNHERIAPSSYQNIAIAHTLSNSDIHSFIALSIHPEGVVWGENQVNMVFLISLEEKDRQEFKSIFDALIKIISNGKAFSEMLKVKNYEELKAVFRTYL